jgi:hypothetical protein
MLGATSADLHPEDGSRVSPWLLATTVTLLVVSFAGGALLFGLGGAASAPAPVAEGAGCREEPLAFGLGDDPAVQRRMALAERVPVPEAGFYTASTAPSADELLHAGSHGFVVVRYRVAGEAAAPLRRLVTRKAGDYAVLAVPAGGRGRALTATMWGRELRCGASGPRQLRSLERFIDSLAGGG